MIINKIIIFTILLILNACTRIVLLEEIPNFAKEYIEYSLNKNNYKLIQIVQYSQTQYKITYQLQNGQFKYDFINFY